MFGASSGSGTLPPLPKIAGDVDLMLDVYTHPSLRNSSNSSIMTNEEYGDTSRLAELGSKVLELAVSYHLYSEKPFLESDKIRVYVFPPNATTFHSLTLTSIGTPT